MKKNAGILFNKLYKLSKNLRGSNGCLWDKKQTHKSLIPFLKEEAEEVINAIESGDKENLAEELGDLLYQVIFHAQIAEETGDFTISDVVAKLINKLVTRHPHVFGKTKVNSVDDIIKNWHEIKKKEKAND